MNEVPEQQAPDVDAVVVGAGFAGMAMIRKFLELGFSVLGFERGRDVGGTWYWNRYPGARCDAPSMQYSYQFSEALQQDWHWTETYAAQPEILAYARHVADRFGIRERITFGTRVLSALYDEAAAHWTVTLDSGENLTARYCVMATGNLSDRLMPDIEGFDSFRGERYHTAEWPQEGVDFSGKRVGVIGTGSTGIQAIPVIAESAGELKVFQRTPQYSIPARNTALDPAYEARIKADYAAFRARNYTKPLAMDINLDPNTPKTFDVDDHERRRRYETGWRLGGMNLPFSFRDSATTLEGNEAMSQFIRDKIDEIVDDPATAELLKPRHVFGCKRPCLDSGYFETFNRDNVDLVDCSRGIERIVPKGIEVDGVVHELDIIVLATGFDAITGTLKRIDIRGRGGQALSEKWAAGPRTYLGLQSAGFPNLFMISGPGSPAVLTNMIPTIEQHVNFIGDCLATLRSQGQTVIEARQDAEDPWMETVAERAGRTLYGACDNWYAGANVPGKPRVFMLYVDWPSYMRKCEAVAAADYAGFERS